jgi:hypothetical protein
MTAATAAKTDYDFIVAGERSYQGETERSRHEKRKNLEHSFKTSRCLTDCAFSHHFSTSFVIGHVSGEEPLNPNI